MPKPRSSGFSRSMRVSSSQIEPRGQREQAGDAVQRRRLAAARRPEQGDELAPLDVQLTSRSALKPPKSRPTPSSRSPRKSCGASAMACRLYLRFAPPTCSSQSRNAKTSLSGVSGSSIGLSAISSAYSGRPNSLMASWLSCGAMASGTSFRAGPG